MIAKGIFHHVTFPKYYLKILCKIDPDCSSVIFVNTYFAFIHGRSEFMKDAF